MLKVLNSAVYAASDRVDMVIPGQIQKLFNTIQKITNKNSEQAKSWNEWINAVKNINPSLLVLLPHTSKSGPQNANTMEIGKNSKLTNDYIKSYHIRPTLMLPPPVVLLLGCETIGIDNPFQSFIAQFRRNGAAIVLSTLTEILGRHAAPIAEKIIDNLKQVSKEGKSLGDALIVVRRKALAEGIPMVLSLVAYGDADWRFKS